MLKIKVEKGELLQAVGETETKFYRVHSGLLHSYSLDKKGRKSTFMFAPEGWIIADCSLPQDPCELCIETLEPSVISIHEKIVAEIDDNERLFRRILALQKRVIMFQNSSTIERYEYFEETYPSIIQRVSQKMIASYLGVTPEALSKAKGDKLRMK
ncbi:MAG: Crp/Fnr family transcriptional regulator [Bacteroidota bacterium]